MGPVEYALIALGTLVALAAGYGLARLLDRSRLKSVRSQAEVIAKTAREEAEKLKKEAELKAKDDLYQQREEFKRETEQARSELRDQERRLAKREDGLEEKNQALLKKERSLDHLKSKVAERRGEVGARKPDQRRSRRRDIALERLFLDDPGRGDALRPGGGNRRSHLAVLRRNQVLRLRWAAHRSADRSMASPSFAVLPRRVSRAFVQIL